jgi:hypothetical protein
MVVCALLCASVAAEPRKLADVAFLAGSWIRSDGNSSSEEHWLQERGGMMLGLYRKVHKSGKVTWEYLRLERREEGIFYVASPNGRPETSFKLVKFGPGFAEFENPEHDFPTRIVYTLQNDGSMKARIEGELEGEQRSREFHWQRADPVLTAP